MNKLEETLFLITAPGDRHEDHVPERVMPLYKIKGRVSILAYEKLLELVVSKKAKWRGSNCKDERYHLWETGIGFVEDEDRSNYPSEVNKIIDRYLINENITEEEWNLIVLEEGCVVFRSFFPLKLDAEKTCEIDRL